VGTAAPGCPAAQKYRAAEFRNALIVPAGTQLQFVKVFLKEHFHAQKCMYINIRMKATRMNP